MCPRLCLTSSLLMAASLGAAPATVDDRPNIVLLYADDLGYGDLSSYGSTLSRTPAIDSLGQDGVRFTRFYAGSPECTPSRVALLTGRYPQRVGGLECAIGVGNVGRYDEAVWLRSRDELGLPAGEATLAQRLSVTGYDTAIFGKWHLGYDLERFGPRVHGFAEAFVALGGAFDYVTHREPDGSRHVWHNDKPFEGEGYFTDLVADRAIAWIGSRDRPFFAYVPFTAPHNPYQGPGDGPEPLPWKKKGPDTYRRMVEHLDRRVGDIVAAVDRLPSARNTLVIFVSDNGAVTPGSNAPLRGFKSQPWEGGLRVPCLLRWPAVIPAGRVTEQVASNIDLTATLLAAAGAPANAERPLDGVDLRAVIAGPGDGHERTLHFRYKRGERRHYAVIENSLKLVINEGTTSLFDLDLDPGEARDLAAERPDDLARLRASLDAWQDDVAAPRLRDFRPDPPSAELPR
jgi:N-acetylgalactosamine-6-sulfatase